VDKRIRELDGKIRDIRQRLAAAVVPPTALKTREHNISILKKNLEAWSTGRKKWIASVARDLLRSTPYVASHVASHLLGAQAVVSIAILPAPIAQVMIAGALHSVVSVGTKAIVSMMDDSRADSWINKKVGDWSQTAALVVDQVTKPIRNAVSAFRTAITKPVNDFVHTNPLVVQERLDSAADLFSPENNRAYRYVIHYRSRASSSFDNQITLNKQLEKQLRKYGRKMINNVGRGACLFHAIVDTLKAEDDDSRFRRYSAVDMRAALVRRIRQYANTDAGEYIQATPKVPPTRDWGQYCRNMSRACTWGDEVMVLAASLLLGRAIYVVSTSHPPLKIKPRGVPWEDQEPKFILGFYPEDKGSHYVGTKAVESDQLHASSGASSIISGRAPREDVAAASEVRRRGGPRAAQRGQRGGRRARTRSGRGTRRSVRLSRRQGR
jgi:hypothetical protein